MNGLSIGKQYHTQVFPPRFGYMLPYSNTPIRLYVFCLRISYGLLNPFILYVTSIRTIANMFEVFGNFHEKHTIETRLRRITRIVMDPRSCLQNIHLLQDLLQPLPLRLLHGA